MIVSSSLPVDRQIELAALRQLLHDVQLLDKGSSALTKLEGLVASATALAAENGLRPSFLRFVTDRANALNVPRDRFHELLVLCDLVHTLKALNATIGVLDALRGAVAAAERLTEIDLDTGRPSLLQFVVAMLNQEAP